MATREKNPVCIYCLEMKLLGDFSNTEHVLPEAFGRFEGNLTFSMNRKPAVCNECNQELGNTIDRILARDTYEALLRLWNGLKKPEEVSEILKTRVVLQIPSGKYASMKLCLRPSPDSKTAQVDLISQVGISRILGGGYKFFTEEELKKFNPPEHPTLDSKRGLFLVAQSEADEAKLISILKERGINFRQKERLEKFKPTSESEIRVECKTIIDSVVARGIAKISMNYLAYSQDVPFALKDEFNKIRRFVRYGEGEWRNFVTATDDPILRGESMRYRRSRAHIVLVESLRRVPRIRGRVSPFNDRTYYVALGEFPLITGIASGHAFDIRTRMVSRLGSSSAVWIPR